MQFSVRYIVLFSAAVCIACAVLVSSAAVKLLPRQTVNKALDKKKNVLEVAALKAPDEALDAEQVEARFSAVRAKLIDVRSGEEVEGDATAFDQQKAKRDPATSFVAPANGCSIKRVPERAQIFEVLGDDGALRMVVLPIEGYGLWSTLLGFVALDADLNTVRGITFYDHKETPGLGGEVDNPRWKSLWPGREVFDQSGTPVIEVIKGAAGGPQETPHQVDGLSGATITSRGVTCMVQFWLGEHGFGPYLDSLRQSRRTS